MQIVAVLIQQLLQRCPLGLGKIIFIRCLISGQGIDLHMKDTGLVDNRDPFCISVHILVDLRQYLFLFIVDLNDGFAIFLCGFYCKHS